MYDEDMATSDDLIGECNIFLRDIIQERYISKIFKLTSTGSSNATIELELEYYPDEENNL